MKTPFNAVVVSRNVNIGSQASVQDELAMLAGTDAYWIIASIPVDRLEWIEIPGSAVNVLSSSGALREGRVIKLLATLEERGRMARILIEVDDPLCLKAEHKALKPLLIGEYVHAEVAGRTLEKVYSIPRDALHGNRRIWIAMPDGTLDIREVDVLWRDGRRILVRDGLQEGELLIVSDLTAPIQGMNVTENVDEDENKNMDESGNEDGESSDGS